MKLGRRLRYYRLTSLRYIHKTLRKFQETVLFNKMTSFILLFLLIMIVVGGIGSIYKYYFETIKPIAFQKDVFIYDTAQILDSNLRKKILDINAQFQELPDTPEMTFVSIPSLNGVYVNRYIELLSKPLESLYSGKNILVFVAQKENKIAVWTSHHTESSSQKLAALAERSEKLIKDEGMNASLDNMIQTIFYELLPNSKQKLALQKFALSTEELETAEEHSSMAEIFLKIVIIIAILVLFVRLDKDKIPT